MILERAKEIAMEIDAFGTSKYGLEESKSRIQEICKLEGIECSFSLDGDILHVQINGLPEVSMRIDPGAK